MGKTFSVFHWNNLFQKRFFFKIKMNSLARSTIMARRFFGTGQVLRAEVHPVFAKLKGTQQLYQKDNGLVIHLRAGTRDKVYFYFYCCAFWRHSWNCQYLVQDGHERTIIPSKIAV